MNDDDGRELTIRGLGHPQRARIETNLRRQALQFCSQVFSGDWLAFEDQRSSSIDGERKTVFFARFCEGKADCDGEAPHLFFNERFTVFVASDALQLPDEQRGTGCCDDRVRYR